MGEGADGFESAVADVLFRVDSHPREPDCFDVLVKEVSELLRDRRSVGSEEVVDLGDTTRAQECRSEGARGDGEAAEERVVGGRADVADSAGFVEVGATDVSTKHFHAGRDGVGVVRLRKLFEFCKHWVVNVGVREEATLFGVDGQTDCRSHRVDDVEGGDSGGFCFTHDSNVIDVSESASTIDVVDCVENWLDRDAEKQR